MILKNTVFKFCSFAGLGLALSAGFASAAEVQTNYAGFWVTLETAQDSYPAATPIVLSATMTNGTRERVLWDLPIDGCSCLFGYVEVMALPARTNLPCRRLPNIHRGGPPGHDFLWQDPGGIFTTAIDLTSRYGLMNSGTYEVRLLARMPTPIPMDNKEPTFPTPPLLVTVTNNPASTKSATSEGH